MLNASNHFGSTEGQDRSVFCSKWGFLLYSRGRVIASPCKKWTVNADGHILHPWAIPSFPLFLRELVQTGLLLIEINGAGCLGTISRTHGPYSIGTDRYSGILWIFLIIVNPCHILFHTVLATNVSHSTRRYEFNYVHINQQHGTEYYSSQLITVTQ